MKIAIIGSGAYGLAMTKVLSENPLNELIIWTESSENIPKLKDSEYLNKIIPGYQLPKGIKITDSYEKALKNIDIIFIMVAAQYVGKVAYEMKKYYEKNMHIVLCSKGIDQESLDFVSEVVLKHIQTKKLAVLSGPSFAVDMAAGEPVGLAKATLSRKTKKALKEIFKDSTVKLHYTDDILGIEICGSIKNVIAIASGMIAGMGYSESTQVFLINEALHDIKVLIKHLGGNPRSILSFAGVGDLLLTCSSKKSRNYSLGFIIGSKSLAEGEKYLKNNTVEGYYTVKSIYALIRRKRIKIPIINTIHRILIHGEDPSILIDYLMTKNKKPKE